nr:putative LAGLIDADG homing endonuclease [Chloroidium sp. KL-2023a]
MNGDDKSFSGFRNPEQKKTKGSSETHTRSTSKKKQKNNIDPTIPRLTQEQIAGFSRVQDISLDDFFAYCETDKLGSTKNMDPNFLKWFVGFTEGDGCFTPRYTTDKRAKNPKKVTRLTFEIRQKDPRLMKRLQEKLGFGIGKDNTKSRGRMYAKFVVGDQPSLKRIMHLFNGNLTLPKRTNDPKRVCYKESACKSLQNAWISGFLEAEGCFYASYRMHSIASTDRNPDAIPRYRFTQKVTLTQQDTHGESEVLIAIQNLFGKVSDELYKVNDNTKRVELDALRYHCAVLEYLLRFPLFGKKRLACIRSYRIFLL